MQFKYQQKSKNANKFHLFSVISESFLCYKYLAVGALFVAHKAKVIFS